MFNSFLSCQKVNWNNKLVSAAIKGNFNDIQLALKNKANINTKDKHGNTALHYAVSGRPSLAHRICETEGIDFDISDCIKGRMIGKDTAKIVKFLLSKHADVNAKNNKGEVPLHMISYCSYSENFCKEIVDLLLKNGANVKAKDNSGNTILHLAVKNNFKKLVEVALSKGVDVKVKNSDGITPLHLVESSYSSEIVKLLLNKNADVNAKDNKGAMPLHYIVGNRHSDIDNINLLLNKGANVNARDNNGRTPLHYAYSHYSPKWGPRVIDFLVSKGAKKNIKDNKGNRALPVAFNWPFFDLFKLSSTN